MELQQNLLQQGIFSYINGKVVKMYLSNMHSVYGKVLATDNFTVLIQPFDEKNNGENKTNLIYKSSIVNIEINTLVDVKNFIKQDNQKNKNNKNQQKNNEKTVPTVNVNSQDLELVSSKKKPPKSSQKLVVNKYNVTKEDSEALPELNVFSDEEKNAKEQAQKVDNKEEIQENNNEQAKYSPMNFLNDLQS